MSLTKPLENINVNRLEILSKTRRPFTMGNNGAKKKVPYLNASSIVDNLFDGKNQSRMELVEKFLNNTENNRKAYHGIGR